MQLDVTEDHGSSRLLSYLRLNEGTRYAFDAANPNSIIASTGLSLVTDTDLVICPIGAYPSSDYKKCYQDPLHEMAELPVGIYSVYNEDEDQVYWKFDSTGIDIPYPLKTSWTFDDAILSSIVEGSQHNKTLLLPSFAFRENAKYGVTFEVTNKQKTF